MTAWATAALADLIGRRGAEPLLTAPMLFPNDRYFTDPWSADARGVKLVARRLLTYAGLGHLRVDVQLDGEVVEGRPAAWFLGVDNGVCAFGVDASQLHEPEAIVGALAHEVAHAFIAVHGLAQGDDSERVAGVATIYLGFGVLTTNASYLYRSSGFQAGDLAFTKWSHSASGALSPELMSFLLAAVVRLRGGSEKSTVARELETNQRSLFERAYGALDGDALARTLKVQTLGRSPPKFVTPPPFSPELEVVTAPGRANEGQNVYRILRTRAGLFALVATVIVAPVASIGAYKAGVSDVIALAIAFGCGVAGYVLGKTRHTDYCSACDEIFTGPQITCPKCGGTVVATTTERGFAALKYQQLDD